MEPLWNTIVLLLGLHTEAKDLTFLQVSLRAAIIFICTLVMMRLGHKRSLSRKTAFDSVLIVLLAAILSRAINGSAAFFPTIGGAFVLVALHRLVAWMAYHSHTFGKLVKGSDDIVVENGQFVSAQMRRNSVTRRDIEEDMRLSAKIGEIGAVQRPGSNAAATSVSLQVTHRAVETRRVDLRFPPLLIGTRPVCKNATERTKTNNLSQTQRGLASHGAVRRGCDEF